MMMADKSRPSSSSSINSVTTSGIGKKLSLESLTEEDPKTGINSFTRALQNASLQQQRGDSSSQTWLSAKPHAFSGAVLAPKHARELTPSLALAMAHTLGEYVMNLSEDSKTSTETKTPKTVVQYTEWITEAWSVLGWAEPSASLFWEMATMYHTLHVAGRELSSNHQNIQPQLSKSPIQNQNSILSLSASNNLSPSSSSVQSPPTYHHQAIPPILSCGSSHSIESTNNNAPGSRYQQNQQHYPKSPSENLKSNTKNSNTSNNKCNTASAKELPVWLLGMFLLLHCEEQAFLRNISGEDSRRFDATGTASSRHNSHNATAGETWSSGGEFPSSLGTRSSISPRTRIHAGEYTDNYHCVAFLLRHLRKFLLLTAVPHNPEAQWAIYTLAKSEHNYSQNEYTQRNKHPYRHDDNYHSNSNKSMHHKVDSHEIQFLHDSDHNEVGLDVKLTSEDLERLNFLLQPPSGGLIDEPPIPISDILMKGNNTAETNKLNDNKNNLHSGILLEKAEKLIRKHLEMELREEIHTHGRKRSKDSHQNESASRLGKSRVGNAIDDDESPGDDIKHEHHKELSYTHLRSATILLRPCPDPDSSPTQHKSNAPAYNCSSTASGDFFVTSTNNGRLHDLHISDCSDAHLYLLQPFEHATISACTNCTIVIGAVAGLLHVVDCERTVITSAARRVLVSNCFDILHCVFTPSPPLLVGDNRSCQFAPYNTYYDGIREDLLATGLAAVLINPDFPFDDCQKSPALQCASNKWKLPVELAKLEIPLPLTTSVVPSAPNSPTSGSVGADDKALSGTRPGGGSEDTMKTPVLLPASEFHFLFVPLESEAARQRRLQQENDDLSLQIAGGEDNSLLQPAPSSKSAGGNGSTESAYCQNLADVLQNTPFRLPAEYERRVMMKVDRIRTLQNMIQTELTPEQQSKLEEELNQGFRDWLVTSGNLRQVLDLVHMEKKVTKIPSIE